MSQIILTADDIDAIVLRLANSERFCDDVEVSSTIRELRSASRLNKLCNLKGIDGVKRYVFDTKKISDVMNFVI